MKSLFSKNDFSYMRILPALIMLVMSSVIANADPTSPQWVSTTPKNRVMIVEEHTGVRCMYCPIGHKAAKQLMTNNPGKVFVINFHTAMNGPVPQYEGWDFRTPEGDTLAAAFELKGVPSGLTNRLPVNQNWWSSDGAWASVLPQVVAMPSPVNIYARASINEVSRKMVVEVELYYTGSSDTTINRLTVLLLQNEIIGGQVDGGPFNTDMHVGVIDANQKVYRYRHQHALRKYISPGGTFGQDVSPTTAGSYIYKKYEVDLPTSIRDIPVVFENLEVIAFVAHGLTNIYTGCKAEIVPGNLCNVKLNSNPSGAGILTGAGDYAKGSSVSISATPSSVDYIFQNWTDKNNKVISTNSTLSINLNSDTSLTANFKEEKRYYVTLIIDPADGGKVTGLKEYYLANENCELTATANEGYKFRGWYSGTSSSPSSNLTLKITKDEVITARFVAMPEIISQSPPEVSVEAGAELLLEVNVKGDSCIYQWFKGDETIIDGATQNKYIISSVTAEDAGIYTCEISNFAGKIKSAPIEVTVTDGIAETTITNLIINPTPTKDNINVSLDLEIAGNLTISMVNILGEHLLELYNTFTDAGAFANSFSIKSLPTGSYFLKINHNGNVRMEKIIKQ